MTIYKSQHSSKVISLVLAIAFGVIAIAVTYAAFSGGSLELRSRAAQGEVIIERWEFNETTEGWQGRNLLPLEVKSFDRSGKEKALTAVIQPRPIPKKDTEPPAVFRERIQTLPVGFKKLKMRLRVFPATKKEEKQPFEFGVQYTLQNKRGEVPPVMKLRGIADGQFKEYELPFSETLPLNIDKLWILFNSLADKPNSVVQIDWIRVVRTRPVKPTPTPSALNCDTLYKYNASYFTACSDNGYPRVCFDKYTMEYQGCVTADEDTCTQYNTNASRNILCDSVKLTPTPTPTPIPKP